MPEFNNGPKTMRALAQLEAIERICSGRLRPPTHAAHVS